MEDVTVEVNLILDKGSLQTSDLYLSRDGVPEKYSHITITDTSDAVNLKNSLNLARVNICQHLRRETSDSGPRGR